MPTKYGDFEMVAFADKSDEPVPHILMISPDANLEKPLLVRIHSECMTGDLFGSKRCDCGEQLETSLSMISKANGALIYHRQEGRGIGLINKIKAYNLQDKGFNTVDANTNLGFAADERDYSIPIKMLEIIGVKSINLITNNPEKMSVIDESNIVLNERVPLIIEANNTNKSYLETKKNIMGHMLD